MVDREIARVHVINKLIHSTSQILYFRYSSSAAVSRNRTPIAIFMNYILILRYLYLKLLLTARGPCVK
jgi:hypothetical protein